MVSFFESNFYGNHGQKSYTSEENKQGGYMFTYHFPYEEQGLASSSIHIREEALIGEGHLLQNDPALPNI